MASTAVFTVASKNHLAYARTLFNSVARVHPEYKLFLCLGDEVEGYFDTCTEPFTIIPADRLGIKNFEDMTLRYNVMEFNMALKPFMCRWLFDNTKLETVIYLDSDIYVYSRFDRLEKVLESGVSVVLTPHITKPLEDGKMPNDYHMLQSGVFNAGFFASRRCSETLSFMDWWGRRLSTQCIADFALNLSADQKWCDLAPCFLDELKVFKDPGYNVAYWNLAQRQLHKTADGEWQANGSPLVFFHFSGLSVEKRQEISKHQNRFEWDDIQECQELFDQYRHELITNGWNEAHKWPYAYDIVSEKMAICPLIHHFYRLEVSQPMNFKGIAIDDYLVNLCNQRDKMISDEGGLLITKLMTLVYRLRPDIQAAFNLNTDDGRHQFVTWFEVYGEREYGLPVSITRHNHNEKSITTVKGDEPQQVSADTSLIDADKHVKKTAKYLLTTSREKIKKLGFNIIKFYREQFQRRVT